MACAWIKVDGRMVHVKYTAQRRKRCACGQLADKECDWCDKPVCLKCATHLGKDIDACPDHRYELQEREAIQCLA